MEQNEIDEILDHTNTKIAEDVSWSCQDACC